MIKKYFLALSNLEKLISDKKEITEWIYSNRLLQKGNLKKISFLRHVLSGLATEPNFTSFLFFKVYKLTDSDGDKHTFLPNIAGYHANLLDLFLTSYTDRCSMEVLPLFGTSNRSLIHVMGDAKTKTYSERLFHRTVSNPSLLISECVLSSIESFIPHKTFSTTASPDSHLNVFPPWPNATTIRENTLVEPLPHSGCMQLLQESLG